MDDCKNLIREVESYVWDPREAAKGFDKPMKKDDHCTDAIRYCIASHKVQIYQPYKHDPNEYMRNRFQR
jgi:phage terminase large subunit